MLFGLGFLMLPFQAAAFSVSYQHAQKSLPKEWALALDVAIDEMVEKTSSAQDINITPLKALFQVINAVNVSLFQRKSRHPGFSLPDIAQDFSIRLNYLDFYVRDWCEDVADQIYADFMHLQFMAKHDDGKVIDDGLAQLSSLYEFLLRTRAELITLPHLPSSIHDDFAMLKRHFTNIQFHLLSLAERMEKMAHKISSFKQSQQSYSLVYGSHEWFLKKAQRPPLPKHWITQTIDSFKYYLSPSTYIPDRFLPSRKNALSLFFLVLILGHESQALFNKSHHASPHLSQQSFGNHAQESLDVEKALIGTILKDKYHLLSDQAALTKLTRRHPAVANTLKAIQEQLHGQKPSNDDIFRAMEYHQRFSQPVTSQNVD